MPSNDGDFFAAHPDADVQVDFNEEIDYELTAHLTDFRKGFAPHVGDVLTAGCWGAAAAKAQVLDVSEPWVRLRMLQE